MEEKKSFLFKELDVAFVYIFILIAGILIVIGMTSYLNNKVKEFTDDSIAYTERG